METGDLARLGLAAARWPWDLAGARRASLRSGGHEYTVCGSNGRAMSQGMPVAVFQWGAPLGGAVVAAAPSVSHKAHDAFTRCIRTIGTASRAALVMLK
ncbi:hypothetical protein E4U31_007709 [Claviceps sp. LM219 group G6]|nr:hypothetical protein E4U15_002183 [Claviceps sp. LM218 group G6]KAG6108465.1 hypothetical protein E4U31_007709 [Claviceps sp. LM219 group G6]KAG6112532.1 hypothetical protein E4U14_002047 [Claviceps sp. LM454 group G7]